MMTKRGRLRVAVLTGVLAALSSGSAPAAGQTDTGGQPEVPLPEVQKRGSGPRTLLMIPCAACGWWSFDTFMERNEDRYTMYAVTLPGYGATPIPPLPVNSPGAPWHANAVAGLSKLIDDEGLQDVVVVGHSFGSVIALELVAARPDVVTGMINLDGGITSNRSWFPADPADRVREADELTASNRETYADPQAWRSLNLPTLFDPDRRLLYHGMFMGTSRTATFQYWRENMIVDLNPMLSGLAVPTLDIQAIGPTSTDPEQARRDYLTSLAEDRPSDRVRTVFLMETFHQLHEHRPELVDRIVADWLERGHAEDFRPEGYVADLPEPRPVPLTPADAAAYTGAYATVLGHYDFEVRDGALVSVRSGNAQALIHLGGHRFALASNPRLVFTFEVRNGRAEAFRYQSPGRGLDLEGTRVGGAD